MNAKSAPVRRSTPTGKLIPFTRVQGITGEMSDEALLTACGAGEAAALGALFDRYGERLGRFLRRVASGGDNDVPDLLQATFFEAQRSARRFRRQSSVSTWLIGIAANIVRHHIRSEQRRSKAHAAFAISQQALVVTPGEEAERRQHLTRLSEGIDALPEEIRVVYVMCEIEDISGREAARALGVSEGTIWRRMHCARESLRRVIAGEQK
jgi:RNA polymerase sigma-70 factor (ECF subfamily)